MSAAARSVHSTPIHGPFEFFGVRFEECETGGGCVALRGEMPDGTEVLITGYNEAYLPTRTDWSVGFYDEDGHQIALTAPGHYERDEDVFEATMSRCADCERSYGPRSSCRCGGGS